MGWNLRRRHAKPHTARHMAAAVPRLGTPALSDGRAVNDLLQIDEPLRLGSRPVRAGDLLLRGNDTSGETLHARASGAHRPQ